MSTRPADANRADQTAITVREIVADMLDCSLAQVSLDTDLRADLGATDDDVNDLVLAVEAMLGIDLDDEERLNTVDDLIISVRHSVAGDGQSRGGEDAAVLQPQSRAGMKAGGKKVSPYNQYMKDELPKIKASSPRMSHKEAFKKVAAMWKASPANPNRA
jgi:acyl carrier protein